MTMVLAPTTRSESAGITAVVARVESAQAAVRTSRMKTRLAIRLIPAPLLEKRLAWTLAPAIHLTAFIQASGSLQCGRHVDDGGRQLLSRTQKGLPKQGSPNRSAGLVQDTLTITDRQWYLSLATLYHGDRKT